MELAEIVVMLGRALAFGLLAYGAWLCAGLRSGRPTGEADRQAMSARCARLAPGHGMYFSATRAAVAGSAVAVLVMALAG